MYHNEKNIKPIKTRTFLHALKIPVNVYFIDTLFHNTGYNTTLRNPYLLNLKNTFLKFDCLLIILLLKLVDLIEPPEQ